MGQRANYIIKEGDKLTIHYNHWRANHITSDLYLGERKFLEFVDECQVDEVVMNEPWIEGCVIIDKPHHQLYFWTGHLSRQTSALEYYLLELQKKWPGWSIQYLKSKMYDAEKILSIDYISQQELREPSTITRERIIADKVKTFETAVVIIKDGHDYFITRTGNIMGDQIISYGEEIIPLLETKPSCDLPNEEEEVTYDCVIIDVQEKHLYANDTEFGLWEYSSHLWPGYQLTANDFGYIQILSDAGIESDSLRMPKEKVLRAFKEMVHQSDNFDPYRTAEILLKENPDIQFNPDFFDTVRPTPDEPYFMNKALLIFNIIFYLIIIALYRQARQDPSSSLGIGFAYLFLFILAPIIQLILWKVKIIKIKNLADKIAMITATPLIPMIVFQIAMYFSGTR